MTRPNCILYSIPDCNGRSDVHVRLDTASDVLHIWAHGDDEKTSISLSLDQAEKLAEIIPVALEILRGKPEPMPMPMTFQGTPAELTEILLSDGAIPVSRNVVDPVYVDDPMVGYIIRHEHKDLYYGEVDFEVANRSCSATRDNARVFVTKFEAHRFQQDIRHANTILSVPTAYIAWWRASENSTTTYFVFGDALGTAAKKKASRMTLIEAEKALASFPPKLFARIEKVLA